MIGTALALASGAFNIYQQYQNKPKKDDYVPSGGMYQRYLDHLKSKTAESTVYHQQMRPALRQIGAQTQQANRGIDQFSARNKPGGGVEAQMRLGVNQQALQALGLASEKASFAQQRVNEQTGEQLMRIGIQEEQALKQYRNQKQRWAQQMVGTTAQAGIGVASAYATDVAAKAKAGADAAKLATESLEKRQGVYNAGVADGSIDPKVTPFEKFDQTLAGDPMDSVINQNLDKNFIQRIINANKSPELKNADGSVSSHIMESGEVDGKFIAYPTVVQDKAGKLVKPDDPVEYALKNNEYVEFKTDAEAKQFANNGYKKYFNNPPTGMVGSKDVQAKPYSDKLKNKFTKEQKFEEDKKLEEYTASSTEGRFQITNEINAAKTLEEAETIRKGAMDQGILQEPDREAVNKVMLDKIKGSAPDPQKPFYGEFAESIATGTVKESINWMSKAIATGQVSPEHVIYMGNQIDGKLADQRTAAEYKYKTDQRKLKIELDKIDFEQDKNFIVTMLGGYKQQFAEYEDGVDVVKADAEFESLVDTLKKSTAFGTDENKRGLSLANATGVNRKFMNWVQNVKLDDPEIAAQMADSTNPMIQNAQALQLILGKGTASDNDKRAMTLYIQMGGRINALLKRMPYTGDMETTLDGLY